MSTSPPSPPRRHGAGEEGMALILVLLIGAGLLAMGALAESMFKSATVGATRHVQKEQGLHLAEQGIDQAIGKLQQSNLSYNTAAMLPVPPSTVDTPAEEQAWLMSNFGPTADTSTYGTGWLQSGPQGQFVSVVPNNRKTIYAVSWIPNRADPKRVRVVKAEWLPASFSPHHAIQTDGNLIMAGSSAVQGIQGSVHANGNIQVIGSNVWVDVSVTTSGTFSPADPSFNGPLTGGKAAGVARQDVIDGAYPEDWWASNHTNPTYAGSWYDLCPSGEVRLPDGATPCAGTLIATAAHPANYQGWQYKGTTNTWSYNGAGVQGGVFYAHRANIDISGTPGSAAAPWRATLIASATPGAGTCARTDGEIRVTGGPVMNPAGEPHSLAMLAGTDLVMAGTTATSLDGGFVAVEQVDIGGNGTLNGAIVAVDECHSPSTPVATSRVDGNMSITYDKDVTMSIGKTVRTTLWQELSAIGFVET